MFSPQFQMTPTLTKALMRSEAARLAMSALPIDVTMLSSLRETARLRATHFSTQIEGNRLTEAEVKDVLAGASFPGRERDEAEVRNYYRALSEVEALAGRTEAIREEDIQRIHGLVLQGQASATPYRDGQNVIRDAGSGALVYLPPEAGDVAALMADLVAWITNALETDNPPAPIVAALAHYQIATIHPYYDGNGRTARLLTTLILHRAGYGLKGIYNLDEYYARNLNDYYAALAVGPSHNYYFGRAETDVSAVVTYVCEGMADAFSAVLAQAVKAAERGARDQSALLRRLDPRQRRLLEVFRRHGTVTAGEIAAHLGLSQRTVTDLCRAWVATGFLAVHNASRKNRSYRLGDVYEAAIGQL